MESFKFGNGIWATKEGSSIAYNDENGNYKPLPFSVTRGSSATRVNRQGLIESVSNDKLRIDFKDSSKGVALLEPSRTNELTDSSTNNFSAVRCSRGDEVIKLGTIEGYKYSFTEANPNINFNYSESTLGYKTFSVFIDATNSDEFEIFIATELSSKAASSTFTPSTKSFSSITENATYVRNSSVGYEYFGNNIYRIFITTEFILYDSGSTRPLLYFGDNSDVWIGGAQLEQGSYATSYIPTSGSSVTRSADVANGAGNSNVFNDSQGVLFAEIAALANDGTKRRIAISNGGTSNRIVLGYFTDNSIQSFGSVTTSQFNLFDTSTNINLFNKCAIKYKQNDFALWVNGFEIDTDTSGSVPTGLSELAFDDGAAADDFYGKTKRISYFDEVLTDAELETLTSYTSFTEMANELNLTIK